MEKITRVFQLQPIGKQKENILCRECGCDTTHDIVTSFNEQGLSQDGEGSVTWSNANQIIICAGCETVSFRTVHTTSEEIDYADDLQMYVPRIKYYPPRVRGIGAIQQSYLPADVRLVYSEAVLATESAQPILAGIGIRLILETVCNSLNANSGNLKSKIDWLVSESYILEDDGKTLHLLRQLGNDAAHRAKAGETEQLVTCMNILNGLLERIYVTPTLVKEHLTS